MYCISFRIYILYLFYILLLHFLLYPLVCTVFQDLSYFSNILSTGKSLIKSTMSLILISIILSSKISILFFIIFHFFLLIFFIFKFNFLIINQIVLVLIFANSSKSVSMVWLFSKVLNNSYIFVQLVLFCFSSQTVCI